MAFVMAIMYYKFIVRKRWDSRASCIESGTDTITDNIKQELSDLTLDSHSVEEQEKEKEIEKGKEKTLIQKIQYPTEHPITQEPLPDDIHDLFNPKIKPRNGALVQFSERDLLSFPKTALSGNEMIKELKLQENLKKRDQTDGDDVPLGVLRKNSCSKRVGRSVVKYPSNGSRNGSEERVYAGSRHSSRNASRRRATSRARSEYDDRHSKFENPKYRGGNKDFEEYYLKFLVPTISAVVQQTLHQTLNPKNNYVDQWVNNQEVTSVDGLQTPSLKSF